VIEKGQAQAGNIPIRKKFGQIEHKKFGSDRQAVDMKIPKIFTCW
jgi:hypothetical protein